MLLVRVLAGDLLYSRAEMVRASILRIDPASQGPADPSRPTTPQEQAILRQADKQVDRSVRLNPVSERALLTQTKNLATAKEYAKAKEYGLRSHQALTTEASFVQLGWVSLELGQRARAKEYFQKALAINPANPEALERLVWISKLDLNEPNLADRRTPLNTMLDGLWNLQRYSYFNANLSYLWSQYWHERALTSKSQIHYLAGYRAAALADNRPVPKDRPALYKIEEIALIANYFMMGARGLPIVTSGQRFAAKRPVNTSLIQFDQ